MEPGNGGVGAADGGGGVGAADGGGDGEADGGGDGEADGGGDGEADGGGLDGEADGGGDGEADGGGDGEVDGGGDGEAGGGSHWVALGAGSHVSRTSRLEWQRASNGGSSFGLYCPGSSGEYSHGEKVPSVRVMYACRHASPSALYIVHLFAYHERSCRQASDAHVTSACTVLAPPKARTITAVAR